MTHPNGDAKALVRRSPAEVRWEEADTVREAVLHAAAPAEDKLRALRALSWLIERARLADKWQREKASYRRTIRRLERYQQVFRLGGMWAKNVPPPIVDLLDDARAEENARTPKED